jgi:hypothetical protein
MESGNDYFSLNMLKSKLLYSDSVIFFSIWITEGERVLRDRKSWMRPLE